MRECPNFKAALAATLPRHLATRSDNMHALSGRKCKRDIVSNWIEERQTIDPRRARHYCREKALRVGPR